MEFLDAEASVVIVKPNRGGHLVNSRAVSVGTAKPAGLQGVGISLAA